MSQKFVNYQQPVDSESLMKHLKAAAADSSAKWIESFNPVWEANKDGAEHTGKRKVYLECITCNTKYLATNPSQTLKRHKCGQATAALDADEDAAAGEALAAASTLSTGKRSATEAAEQSAAKRQASSSGQGLITDSFPQLLAPLKSRMLSALAMYFFTSDTAMNKIGNLHLREVFALVGINLPSEKTLRTTMLEKCHAEIYAQVMRELDALMVSLLIC